MAVYECMQIQDGMERLEYALHYGIPYPRLAHVKQFSPRQYQEKPQESVRSPKSSGCVVQSCTIAPIPITFISLLPIQLAIAWPSTCTS